MNRGKAIVNSSQPIYDQEPSMVAEDDETSKDKEIDKLMALISLSSAGYENQRIGNVVGARESKPKRAKNVAYHREKMLLCKQEEAGIQLNVEQADWRDDTDDDELEDQELEAHYMYMAQLQESIISAINLSCSPSLVISVIKFCQISSTNHMVEDCQGGMAVCGWVGFVWGFGVNMLRGCDCVLSQGGMRRTSEQWN
nr:hypothetical protein [Tanacetum cinerariifolium]